MPNPGLIAISWVLITFGWVIMIWNSNRISDRSDIRNLCDKMLSRLDKIHEQLYTIWTTLSTAEDHAEASIDSQLSVIELLNMQVGKLCGTPLIPTACISQLRDISTDGIDDAIHKYKIELEQGATRKDITNRISEINLLIHECIDTAESNFHKIHSQTRFWQSLVFGTGLRTWFWAAFTSAVGLHIAKSLGDLLNNLYL